MFDISIATMESARLGTTMAASRIASAAIGRNPKHRGRPKFDFFISCIAPLPWRQECMHKKQNVLRTSIAQLHKSESAGNPQCAYGFYPSYMHVGGHSQKRETQVLARPFEREMQKIAEAIVMRVHFGIHAATLKRSAKCSHIAVLLTKKTHGRRFDRGVRDRKSVV